MRPCILTNRSPGTPCRAVSPRPFKRSKLPGWVSGGIDNDIWLPNISCSSVVPPTRQSQMLIECSVVKFKLVRCHLGFGCMRKFIIKSELPGPILAYCTLSPSLIPNGIYISTVCVPCCVPILTGRLPPRATSAKVTHKLIRVCCFPCRAPG